MGINLEYITILSSLSKRGLLPKSGKVLEFGAQDISAESKAVAEHIRRCGMHNPFLTIDSAQVLYKVFGLDNYTSIDASGVHGALVFDINSNLGTAYGFTEKFDLVTDLGTFEHCFDIANAFRNAHETCKAGGIIIHALPSNCNANHGYYVIQPRMIADISASNNYEIIEFAFTVDYRSTLYHIDLENYKTYDDRDIMFYVVLRKNSDTGFCLPFDSVFTELNRLNNYKSLTIPLAFKTYIKGSWSNVLPKDHDKIPTVIKNTSPTYRKWIKHIIDRLGDWC